jgi:hypothetical protein
MQELHFLPCQYGAFVQHAMKHKQFYGLQIQQDTITVSYQLHENDLDLVVEHKETLALFQKELKALADLDPMPCVCGCGCFLAIDPCFQQMEIVHNTALNKEEQDLCRAGNKIGAIKSLRARQPMITDPGPVGYIKSSMSLREAKDLVDAFIIKLDR